MLTYDFKMLCHLIMSEMQFSLFMANWRELAQAQAAQNSTLGQ